MTEHKYISVYTREHLAERLVMFKDGYKDNIPENIIHSADPDNKYKIRTA